MADAYKGKGDTAKYKDCLGKSAEILAMEIGGIFLGRGIATPLFRQHVHEDRAVDLPDLVKHLDKPFGVMKPPAPCTD